MIILECEQQSAEWSAARLGIPTSSGFDKIITTDGKPSKQAEKYMYQLAGERIAKTSEDGFKSKYMERGNELEDEARRFYEMFTDSTVRRVGVCYADHKKYACSPDGLVGEDGGIQIKCPSMAVHVGYLVNGKLPTEYFQQVQGELLCTGRSWWDFVSYYPKLKPLIVRVYRDENFIKELQVELEVFCAKLDEITERIR
ncbi:MAG TPA: YqaJ viral recombinase family protein [Blastocatellia bacterium]|nr:YqaJ viral recombinase family protein [Blastocatellia bacterium]